MNNLAKHREQQRLYRQKHLGRCNQSLIQWRLRNPNYRKSFNTYFSEKYLRVKERVKNGKKIYVGLYCLNKSEWKEFLSKTIKDRRALWENWVANGYQRRFAPSIDRINPDEGYACDNLRWLPQWQNSGLARPRQTMTDKGQEPAFT